MTNTISKILIVDDNTFYLSLLKTILNDLEASVFMASSGKEALKLINKHDFALAVLDIQMPEMDGFELADQIRNLQHRDLIPIIFLTAYFSDDIQMFKGYHKGAIDFLTKPVNKDVFISKVKVFLELDAQKRNLIENKESLLKSKLELERKQHEMELQNIALQTAKTETENSRKKYIKLYDFAPTGYLTIQRDGKILEINLKGAKMIGSEPSQLIKKDLSDFIAKSMLSVLHDFLISIFENKLHSSCELILEQINGKSIYIYLEGALLDEGQQCLLSLVDVSDRMEAQIALKASEELYHSLLKTSPDGIIVTDLSGKITEASDIAIELLGGKSNDIEGKHFLQFIPKDSRREIIKLLRKTQTEGMVQNCELKLKRLDNIEFSGEISSSLIKHVNGETNAFMAVIRDISERKHFEKQLRHSERMTGIGELATGMAHEINQPLNTISLSLDNVVFSLGNNTCTEAYLKSKIDKVFDGITRIKKIIDHVRTFSRDQDDFNLKRFDINTSIQNSISMISEQFSHKDISISFNPDKNLPGFTGNAYRFEQVILNMLINAKDAIEERRKSNCTKFRKKIEISTALSQNQAIVEIKDNGIGINPEFIDKVLLPFFTTKAPGQGTGLGLSISYGIIKELDGEIDIQSKPGVGTTIQIKLPVQNSRNNKYTINHVQ